MLANDIKSKNYPKKNILKKIQCKKLAMRIKWFYNMLLGYTNSTPRMNGKWS